uniref:Pecanex-like protein n=1 Tax=Macrostomum lignano TaxID=282301 RepID=A0A1I8FSZ0_9PLAT
NRGFDLGDASGRLDKRLRLDSCSNGPEFESTIYKSRRQREAGNEMGSRETDCSRGACCHSQADSVLRSKLASVEGGEAVVGERGSCWRPNRLVAQAPGTQPEPQPGTPAGTTARTSGQNHGLRRSRHHSQHGAAASAAGAAASDGRRVYIRRGKSETAEPAKVSPSVNGMVPSDEPMTVRLWCA